MSIFKNVKVGDKITVVYTIIAGPDDDGDVKYATDGGASYEYLYPRYVADQQVTIESPPRPLQVGDKVKHADSSTVITIKAIDGDEAWGNYTDNPSDGNVTYPLAELIPA